MPTRTNPWPTGTPCWVDLSVPDLAAAKEFYGAVFGWSFVDSGAEFGHYQICQVGGRAAAAIAPCQSEGQPTVWTVYVASDDADGTAKLIGENGGTVLAEPMDIPGSGRMCIAQDPLGAAFGVWQAAGTHGAEVYAEPGSWSGPTPGCPIRTPAARSTARFSATATNPSRAGHRTTRPSTSTRPETASRSVASAG